MHSQCSVKHASFLSCCVRQKQPVLYLLENIVSLSVKISLVSSYLVHFTAAELSVEPAGPSICPAFGQPFTSGYHGQHVGMGFPNLQGLGPHCPPRHKHPYVLSIAIHKGIQQIITFFI